MNTIERLNHQYVQVVSTINVLRKYETSIASVINHGSNDEVIARAAIAQLTSLSRETDCSKYLLLTDTLMIGNQYLNCLDCIAEYRTVLVDSNNSQRNTAAVSNSLEKLKQNQKRYDEAKLTFQRKYNYSVDSIRALIQLIPASVQKALSAEQDSANRLKDEARSIVVAEYSTELKKSDPISTVDNLPEELLVARAPVEGVSLAILRDIGVLNTYQNINSNLRKQGNVMILSDFEHIEDRRIDEFIIAYILRFIETFPLGTVNVHIFDQNTNYLYKRLNNSFQSENAGELTKRIVQIHSSLNDLATFRDVNCEDVFKKTSVAKPDLFAIYDDDRSDPFNLIILRDGLVDGSGYAPVEILDTVNSLTKPGEIGHRCGLRFLIVDNSVSFEKNLTASSKHFLSSIQTNCALRFQFNHNEGFSINRKPIEVLHMHGDIDAFVQERSLAIANKINSKEKSYITLADVSADDTVKQPGNIMTIPVGKSGGSIVELPLSCKDEDGTVAGQCIGYIAIGQSGSGKSSFFHSLVLNGCKKYSPKDLQFWLLDFKNGGASSKYSDSGIPHIKIIAENNKIDDALCLFQMVLEEMERRSRAFNRCFTDNIIEYNKKASSEGLEYFPRIVIAIDEVQEIFREDNASVIQKLISSISTRMRSAGMHFIMVAQNLSEGKSYMLKDAFMPSATGRICFRVSPDIPRDSGFEEEFIQRKQEISELKTGEAYVSYGKGTIKKVKMAFVSPQDMSDTVFAEIRAKYRDYLYLKPRVIGSKVRLSILSSRQGIQGTYQDVLAGLTAQNGVYDVVLGEDVYRMNPFHVRFSQHENSSILLLGSDKQMASSFCTSVALSLLKQDAQMHLFNGDKSKVSDGYGSVPHPFMALCQSIGVSNAKAKSHRLDQLTGVLQEMYSTYLIRQAAVQRADDEELSFPAVFLIVNDLFGIESFIDNDIVESETTEKPEQGSRSGGFDFNYDIFSDQAPVQNQKEGQFREGVQNIVSTLVKNGYRYNLHLVLAIKGDPAIWRSGRTVTSINNIILFNDTDYADQIENSYYIREMLKNISNDGEETVAVWANRKAVSKIRPIIYKMTSQQESDALLHLLTN